MKFFKSTLAIIVLCMTSSMFAARRSAVTQQTPSQGKVTELGPETVTLVLGTTYPEIFAKIKTMPANMIVDNAGNTLQPAFVKSVLNTPGISQTEAEALFQAAVNMHATWNAGDTVADNQRNTAKLASLNSQIMSSAQQVRPLPLTPSSTPEYYDAKTNLLNEALLTSRIKDSLRTNTAPQVINMLRTLYIDKMMEIWNKLNLDGAALIPALDRQITAIVTNVANTERRYTTNEPTPMTTQRFYNDKTNTLDQNALNAVTFEKLQQNIPVDTIISSLTKQYQDAIVPIWREKNIKDVPAKIKALKKQITDTVQTISKQMASKKAVGGQIVKQEEYESFDNPLFEGNKPNTSYEQLKRRAEKP